MLPDPSALRDALRNADVRQSGNAAMATIDAVQLRPPAVQLMGITAAFLLLSKAYGMRPTDLFTYADNLMHAADKKRPEFRGVAAYIENELINPQTP